MKRKSKRLLIDLLGIGRRHFKRLQIPGITLKLYDAVNKTHKIHPFNASADVVLFLLNYKGNIITTSHVTEWKNNNIMVKINDTKITDILFYLKELEKQKAGSKHIRIGSSYISAKNKIKYQKYNNTVKGQKRYEKYKQTGKAQQRYKKYNGTKNGEQRYKRYTKTEKSKQRYNKYKKTDKSKQRYKKYNNKKMIYS